MFHLPIQDSTDGKLVLLFIDTPCKHTHLLMSSLTELFLTSFFLTLKTALDSPFHQMSRLVGVCVGGGNAQVDVVGVTTEEEIK